MPQVGWSGGFNLQSAVSWRKPATAILNQKSSRMNVFANHKRFWSEAGERGFSLLWVNRAGSFGKIDEPAYPPTAERIAATAKSLGIEVAIAEKIDI